MPIVIKGQKIDNPVDQFTLENKRASRDSRRTKYHLMRKDKTPEDYQRVKLVIDGKEVERTHITRKYDYIGFSFKAMDTIFC